MNDVFSKLNEMIGAAINAQQRERMIVTDNKTN